MLNCRVIAKSLLAATALVAFASPAAAQNIDRIVAFGDSLADTGNALQLLLSNPGVPAATKAQLQALYPTGRFSGGTNYIDTLSQILNAPVLNYAVGGAQTGALNQFTGLPGFTQETAIFLSGATPPGTIFPANSGFQEGDLLALSIGINDGRAFYQTNPAGTIAQAQAAASTSVTNATNNLNLLVAAGAPTISYVALNAGLTPDVLTNPTAQALGNAFSTSFNSGFQTTLAGYAADGVMVHYLDGPTVLANVAANPGASALRPLLSGRAGADLLHQRRGFSILCRRYPPHVGRNAHRCALCRGAIDAPLTLQATSDMALDTARQFGRTLTTRMDLGAPRDGDTSEGFKLFVVGDMFSRDVSQHLARRAFDVDGVGASIGAEYGFGNGVVGVAANYSQAARQVRQPTSPKPRATATSSGPMPASDCSAGLPRAILAMAATSMRSSASA